MNPEGVRVVTEGDARAHGEDIGIDGHGKHDRREDSQNLHGEIELV